jgi:hypothetical protein
MVDNASWTVENAKSCLGAAGAHGSPDLDFEEYVLSCRSTDQAIALQIMHKDDHKKLRIHEVRGGKD